MSRHIHLIKHAVFCFVLLGWNSGAAAAEPASENRGRFLRQWWYEPGIENGNPVTNRRFRVNSPEAVLHPKFSQRSETKSSGMLQILMPEDLLQISGAELAWNCGAGIRVPRIAASRSMAGRRIRCRTPRRTLHACLPGLAAEKDGSGPRAQRGAVCLRSGIDVLGAFHRRSGLLAGGVAGRSMRI